MSNFTDFIGGGGGSEVNDVKFITNSDNLITTESGEVWLKGGVTETDTTTYPDATSAPAYTGTTFSTAGQATSESDIGFDGTYFWVLDRGTNAVYKYNDSGVYQNVTFSVASQSTSMFGIVCVGSDFYTSSAGATPKVYKYNSSGVFQSDWSVLSEGNYPYGLTYDGTHLWVINDSSGGDWAFKYSTTGVYQNVRFKLSDQDNNPHGLTWDGTSFWMCGRSSNSIYKYNASGVYQNVAFSVASQGTDFHGLVSAGTALWTVDASSSAAFKYAPQIGCGAGTEGTSNNLYTRIK